MALPAPKCFISYSWESESHKSWVRQLATDLRTGGVDVILDQWDLKLGDDLHQFMESSIRESDYVILVCTPAYARKADAGKGGAGYEKSIVTGEMYYGASRSKFVPLLRTGSPNESLPSFLKPKNFVDFSQNAEYSEKLEDLIRHLLKVPKYPRPKLGAKPFRSKEKSEAVEERRNNGMVVYCRRCGVLTGSKTECTGFSSSHDFASGTGTIYCECCGEKVGIQSECIGLSSAHDFASGGDGSEYCERCGVKVGRRSECTGFEACHHFVHE